VLLPPLLDPILLPLPLRLRQDIDGYADMRRTWDWRVDASEVKEPRPVRDPRPWAEEGRRAKRMSLDLNMQGGPRSVLEERWRGSSILSPTRRKHPRPVHTRPPPTAGRR